MKKALITLSLLVGCAGAASAQRTIIKANIFSPLVKTGSFFVEHRVGEQSSLQLGGLFTHWSVGDTDISGFAFTPEYRLYLSKDKPVLQGFYVAPFLRYQNLTLKTTYSLPDDAGNTRTEHAKAALTTFGGGLVAGHQWVFRERFSLDLFLGPSYNGGTIKAEETSTDTHENFDAGPLSGFGIRTGVTFGVAF
jgi:hypothetical protein